MLNLINTNNIESNYIAPIINGLIVSTIISTVGYFIGKRKFNIRIRKLEDTIEQYNSNSINLLQSVNVNEVKYLKKRINVLNRKLVFYEYLGYFRSDRRGLKVKSLKTRKEELENELKITLNNLPIIDK